MNKGDAIRKHWYITECEDRSLNKTPFQFLKPLPNNGDFSMCEILVYGAVGKIAVRSTIFDRAVYMGKMYEHFGAAENEYRCLIPDSQWDLSFSHVTLFASSETDARIKAEGIVRKMIVDVNYTLRKSGHSVSVDINELEVTLINLT